MTTVAFHLSRVVAPRALIDDHYGAHRAFWRAYGLTDETRGQIQPFRFREDRDQRSKGPVATYLVQSARMPKWDEVLGLRADLKSVEFELENGMALFFRLRACVQRTVADNGRKRKITVMDPRGVENWLYRQGDSHGFVPTEFVFTKPELTRQNARIKNGDGFHEFTLGDTQFDGQLRVTDADRLAKAIVEGVGPKAAFGFGMLSVSR